LHDLIPHRRDAQFPFLAIWFGKVDGSGGLKLEVFRFHLLDRLPDAFQRKTIDGPSIRTGC
jgi:hypothetical protein